MGVSIREKRGKLHLDIYVNGKRTWEATGLSITADPEQNKEVWRLAEVLRSKRELQIISGEWGLVDHVGSKQSLYSYSQKVAEETGNKRLLKALKHLERYKGGNTIKLSAVTGVWFDGFQQYLLKESGLSQTTASHYSSQIRQVLHRAVRDNILAKNPASIIKGIPILESEKVHLTIDEIQKLANAPLGGKLGAEVKIAFLFACFTGLRISDIRLLTWGEIERNPLQIKKRQKKTKRFVIVPMNQTAWDLINDNQLHDKDELVFPLVGTTKTNTNQYLNMWAERVGLQKQIGWHTARRTFATLTLEQGAEILTVSKLLGHTKVSTTAVYAKPTDKLKRNAVNALPEITIAKKAGGEK